MNRKIKIVALVAALSASAIETPYAQVGLPSNCTPQLSVQTRNCSVTNHYSCTATAFSRFAYSYDSGGLQQAQILTDEYSSIRTFYPSLKGDRTTGLVIDLAPGAPAPLSLTELIATGRNDYEYEFRRPDPKVVIHYQGFDELTGEAAEIDGISMLVTNFRYERTTTIQENVSKETVSGSQYVNVGLGIFFGGLETYERETKTVVQDRTPVDLIFPGEPDFMSTTPLYGCDVHTS